MSYTKRMTMLAAMAVLVVMGMMGCSPQDDDDSNSGGGGGNNPTVTRCSFTNPSTGQSYRTVLMPDGKEWMAENLNCATGNSWCYDNNSSNCNTYGRLYDWNTARGACPVGWKLPTRQDWENLVQSAGGLSVAGRAFKADFPDWNGDDVFGFSALSGGFRRSAYSDFLELGNWGNWWGDTESAAGNPYRMLIRTTSGVNELWDRKSNGHSVRCVRE